MGWGLSGLCYAVQRLFRIFLAHCSHYPLAADLISTRQWLRGGRVRLCLAFPPCVPSVGPNWRDKVLWPFVGGFSAADDGGLVVVSRICLIHIPHAQMQGSRDGV